MLKKLSAIAVDHPKKIIIIFLIVTIFFALQIPKTKIDTAIKSQIPPHMASRVRLNKIEELFGGTEIIMVSIKADNVLKPDVLRRLQKISSQMQQVKEVDKINSPFTMQDVRGEDNGLVIEDAIKDIPVNQKEQKQLQLRIKNNDLVYGTIIAKDFKAAAVVGVLKEGFKDKVVLNKLQKIVADTPGPGQIYIAGLPATRAETADYMKHDLRIFIPVGLLVMLVFLYFCFRELRGVLLPTLVVVMSIIVAMGLIPLLGWKIQLITVILPIFLLAITNDYAIHIVATHQQQVRNDPELPQKEIVQGLVQKLGNPIIYSGLTTIVGLLCLLAHIIVPARQLGVLAAVGNGFALLASILFVPAVLSLLTKKNHQPGQSILNKNSLLEKLLNYNINLVTNKARKVLIITGVVVAIIAAGILWIKVDTNPIHYFSEEAAVVKSNQLMNQYFGGANNISIVAKGDIKSPAVMNEIDALEKKLQQHPHVGEVTAISELMREMNQVIHNEQREYYRIPNSRNAISQYFMLYTMSDDLDKLVDFDRRHALITARIATNSTNQINEVVDYTREYIAQQEETPFTLVGGFADLLTELVDAVVHGQIYSLLLSLSIVAGIVMILFKSIRAGLIAAIPLSLAMGSLFGLMGYFQIELNMVTALLSSIMIGVGIDYTIHFLWHYREEKKTKSSIAAVTETLSTVGRAIIYNALSVIVGFAVLMLSNFLPVRFFGFLVVVSIAGCLLGALVVLPAICIVFEPQFLERG